MERPAGRTPSRSNLFLFLLLSSFLALPAKGQNELPVFIELRSPELRNLILEREPEPLSPVEDPVSVSSIKLTSGNFWTRALKKPTSNWRDHYIRSSRMSPSLDELQAPGMDFERPASLEEDTGFGPMLLGLEQVAFRQQNSAQKNHYLRTRKASASASSASSVATLNGKPKSNNIQSHYLRSSRSVEPGRKRQTSERDHYLRTVRSSNLYANDFDNNGNVNNNNNAGNTAADRKAARDHYFRSVKRGNDDEEEQLRKKITELQLAAFNSCINAAIENLV